MTLYKKIKIKNLKQIQQDALSIFPKERYDSTSFFFLPDSAKTFLKFKSIRTMLDSYGLTSYVEKCCVGYSAISPKIRIPIHKDSGGFTYSFNIPLTESKKSFVNFYETAVEPKLIIADNEKNDKALHYYDYNINDCTVIDKLETSSPYVLDTQVPHDVYNGSDEFRIMLLLRIDNSGNQVFEKVFDW